ncbi:glycosyltransferase family 2 protein [Hanstruepera flava]|uniref:glycosyltransferase family 2 protein n=1 Tax=Hanstruepera flava TaxID=2930218 RepID=UPI00202926A2|nr:glycosyltransferase family A protein [Hanstruepera flava]
MKPKVSIIIPNYNHKPYLQQRLDSVFHQTYQDFEVILLDDASTDGSQDLLKPYQNHPKVSQLIINKTNSGSPFKQWQKGIALAKGKYIWIAESDDYCELDLLETCLEDFSRNPQLGLVYTQSLDVDEKGKRLRHREVYTNTFKPNIWQANFTKSGREFINDYLLVKNVIPNASAVVFKKELVTKQTFTNSLLQMRMCGDWFFWLQLVQDTNMAFINKPLNYFRHHSQVSRNHKTPTIKKQRLLEEATIRDFALDTFGLFHKSATKTMYLKWFALHTKYDIFKPYFYQVRLKNKSYGALISDFFTIKLKNL